MNDALTIVFLIRHGETAWNVEEVFRGRADVPLNDRGREQAQAVARALVDEPVTAVHCGPLARAADTARAIADAHGLPVQIDERFTDLDFGEWEGAPLADAPKRWPELFARWERDPGAVEFPGGESLPIVRERAMNALSDVAARHPGETIAIVTHRVPTKLLILAALGLDDGHFWRIRQDNACMNRLEHRGDWVVVSVNDVCHLRGLRAPGARDF